MFLRGIETEKAAQRFTSGQHRFISFAAVQISVRKAPQAARRRFLRGLDQGDLRRHAGSFLQSFARWVLSVIRAAAGEALRLRKKLLLEEWLDEQAAVREGYALQEDGTGDDEPAYEPVGLELSWATAGASL